MGAAYEVLRMSQANGVISFERSTIPEDNLPDTLNGESGHHVCYVNMLTGEIAKRLVQMTDQYQLDDDEIAKIALAASLHDIGKSRVPKAILEKKGTLTPVEYDIVKHHTVLGYEMIQRFGDSLEEDVRAYAQDIARHHHERYDGTGYPDGLKGDDIPIWAQIVSIADAYEAITAERAYKKAISQDIALDMIANGLSGVFNPLLIECLIQVSKSSHLERIRKGLIASRAVLADPDSLAPHNVLLLGNLRYITQQFLDDTFSGARIALVGKPAAKLSHHVKIYDVDMNHYKELLGTYDFDFIVYFGNELTYDTMDPSDTEALRQVLKSTRYMSGGAKFLYLSSLDAAFEEPSDRGIVSAAKERLCQYWAEKNKIDLKIVRIPYLYSGTAENDYLHSLFEDMRTKRFLRMREHESSKIYFLSMDDLSELILRIADAWLPGEGILTVNDDFQLTFADLCKGLAALAEGITFKFTGRNAPKQLELKNTAVKRQYGWFAKISILADLPDMYEAYLGAAVPRPTWRERLRGLLKGKSLAVKILECLLMFALCELLVRATGSTLVFSLVDFRLSYIVIVSTLYGLSFGMGAATLCSISWTLAKVASGTNWLTLFYEPTNWLTFIFYYLVGALCGYVRLKKNNAIQFTQEENHLLEEKLAFTHRMYEDTLNEKRDLKRQIISSRDSFGRIFDITRQLNTVDQRELYLKIVDSFEDILDNKTLSVYSVNREAGFARLEVASRDIMNEVSRSISLDTYAPVMDVLDRGDIWRNNRFVPNMPMYACGISKDDKLLLLVFIWNVQAHQRSLYYVNLFHILCGLTQMSLTRAHEYSQAAYERQHIQGTIIQNAQTFRGNLRVFEELAARKVFRFLPLQVERGGKTDGELSDLIAKCVRVNDVVGKLEDGRIWILLSQAGPNDLKYILPRFEKQGLCINEDTLGTAPEPAAQDPA